MPDRGTNSTDLDQERVPLSPVGREALALKAELLDAASRVLDSGRYILGPNVDAFCAAFATYCGVGHCVGVGNGTDALEIALRAVGVGVGSEVITVANAGGYATTAILAIGAVPVYVDIDPETHLLDTSLAAGAVTDRTAAVVATHLYGAPVNVARLRVALDGVRPAIAGRGVAIVEDCAQAHGASVGGQRVGALGDVAAFSFFPTKNLGAIGDGGAVLSNSAETAAAVRALAQYGWAGGRYAATVPGGRNSRLDEVQAALLAVKLPHLDAWNSRRREIAGRYAVALRGSSRVRLLQAELAIPAGSSAFGSNDAGVFHLGVLVTDEREALEAHLSNAGIDSARHYPTPDHLQPAYAGRFRLGSALPHTERAAETVLSVGTHPSLTDGEVARICEALARFSA